MKLLICAGWMLTVCGLAVAAAGRPGQPAAVLMSSFGERGIPLESGWKLSGVSALGCADWSEAGRKASGASYHPSGWMEASVPGTLLACLVRNGTLPNPERGTNMALIQKTFVNEDYVYRTEFEIPPALSGKRLWLNFEGIARNAHVFVNGTRVGSIYGVWSRGQFDISAVAHRGAANGLAVVILHGTNSSSNPETDKGQGFGGHNIQGNECHPAIPGDGNGIYAEVYLTSTGEVKLADPYVASELPLPDTSYADLTIRTEVRNLSGSAQRGKLIGKLGAITFEQAISLSANETKSVTLDRSSIPALRVHSPRLWWPNGYGEPHLYGLELSYQTLAGAVSDEKRVSFGIRKVGYDASVPGNLKILVNGVPIFCRGGSWMSPDLFMRYDAAKAEIDARLHQELGFTMVRFWKGQVPFRQALDAFDRHGLLAWCEWMGLGNEGSKGDMWGFGGISNPESTEGIRDMLKRMRTHPCVVLYVGNNEKPSPREGLALFRRQQEELHPEILFVGHSTQLPLHPGDGPWSLRDPIFYWNKGATLGFYSEIGLPHVLSVESLRKMMSEADLWPVNGTGMWSYRQIDAFNTHGKKYLAAIDAQYGPSTNIEQFCFKAAALNYENNRAIMEAAGDSMWNGCTGVLLWMSKSAWPNLNWSTYDYFYGVDGTYFGNKKACEPVHIQWDIRNWNVSVVNVTRDSRKNLTAVAEVYDSAGVRQSVKTATVSAAANRKTPAFTLSRPAQLSPVHFIRLQLKSGSQVLSQNFYWNGANYTNYTGLDSMPRVKLGLSAVAAEEGDETVVRATLQNKTTSIAFMPRLVLAGAASGERVLPAFYDDNYVSLVPGESRTLTIRCKTADRHGEKVKLNLDGYNIIASSLDL